MTQTHPSQSRSSWRRLLQWAVSIGILALLLGQVDASSWKHAWEQSAPMWLVGAIVLKSTTLFLHEVRLWMAFDAPRPPMLRVCAIGFAAGVINLVAPGRAGDFASIAMLRRECNVSVGAATTAVGLVAFLEAAMLAVFLLIVIGLGAINFEEVYVNMATIEQIDFDASGHLESLLRVVGFSLIAGTFIGAIAVVIWVKRGHQIQASSPPKGRIQSVMMDTISATMSQLSSPKNLLANAGLAGLQVLGMVGAFAMAMPAVGIHIAYPWVAAAVILLLSSVAAIGLPPALAAGPALASMAVFPLFGVGSIDDIGQLASDPRILAYTGSYWIISQVPAALFGIPCLGGRLDLIHASPSSGESAPPPPPTPSS